MNQSYLVSVVMPCYNSKQHLSHSILSVLNQDYSNFELLICDDGSTDGSLEIIRDYLSRDNRIVLLSNSFSKGAVGARNTCLDAARGQYIAFLDSDDIWDKKKLSYQLQYMIEKNLDFSFTSYFNMSEEGEFLAPVLCPRGHHKLLFNMVNYIGCLTVIYRRSAYLEYRMPEVKTRNDYCFWQCLLWDTPVERIGGLQLVLGGYRVNSYGLSSSYLRSLKYFFSVHKNILDRPFLISLFFSFSYLLITSFKKKFPMLYNAIISKL